MQNSRKYLMCLFFLSISCSTAFVDLQKRVDNQDIIIQQNQIKIANLQYYVSDLGQQNAALSKKVEGLSDSKKIDTNSQISNPSVVSSDSSNVNIPQKKEIPSSLNIRKPQQWTQKEKSISAEIVTDFKNKTEQRAANHPLIGQKIPFSRFVNSNGEVINLNEFMPKKKLLLVILRGFAGSVCIVCSSQTIALNENLQNFHDKNTEVVLVYPGKPETVPHFIASVQNLEESFSLPFPVILDPSLNLVKELSILGSLAKPTSILVDEKRIVRYVYVGKHPGDRPNIPSLLKIIDEM